MNRDRYLRRRNVSLATAFAAIILLFCFVPRLRLKASLFLSMLLGFCRSPFIKLLASWCGRHLRLAKSSPRTRSFASRGLNFYQHQIL